MNGLTIALMDLIKTWRDDAKRQDRDDDAYGAVIALYRRTMADDVNKLLLLHEADTYNQRTDDDRFEFAHQLEQYYVSEDRVDFEGIRVLTRLKRKLMKKDYDSLSTFCAKLLEQLGKGS